MYTRNRLALNLQRHESLVESAYGGTQAKRKQTQTPKVAQLPAGHNLGDPLNARKDCHSYTKNICPCFTNSAEEVQDRSRDQEDEHGKAGRSDQHKDGSPCSSKCAIWPSD